MLDLKFVICGILNGESVLGGLNPFSLGILKTLATSYLTKWLKVNQQNTWNKREIDITLIEIRTLLLLKYIHLFLCVPVSHHPK